MDLEADTLRLCKTPHLERLARRLGVSLPAPGTSYHKHLAERVAEGIEFDKRRAAAEERRMTEAVRVAEKIAESLGETGDRPKAQIRRIVGLMGAQWASDACEAAACLVAGMGPDTLGPLRLPDGTKRTFGGVFFAWCRRTASDAVKEGRITRRQFFRAFTDRPKKPKTVPVRQLSSGPQHKRSTDPRKAERAAGAMIARVRGRKAPVPVEVYVSPRRRA